MSDTQTIELIISSQDEEILGLIKSICGDASIEASAPSRGELESVLAVTAHGVTLITMLIHLVGLLKEKKAPPIVIVRNAQDEELKVNKASEAELKTFINSSKD